MAEHDDGPSQKELYMSIRARAMKAATGVLQGPKQEWRPARRPIRPADERDRRDYTLHAGGAPRPQEDALDRAGDGTKTKFTKGFFRKSGVAKEQAAQRAARAAAKAARREAHEVERRRALMAVDKKNGFNVVSGAYDPSLLKDARGRAFIDHKPTRSLAREGERVMRDSSMRFFRVPAAERGADAERARRLGANGLPGAARCSSVLGYGRADVESFGVRDALDKSEYEAPRAAAIHAAAAGGEPRRVRADDAAPTPKGRSEPRRLAPGERAPDRVFGPGAAALAPAMPDAEKRMIRLDREIAKAVGPRPADRPASLLTNAARLEYERERRTLAAEIDMVRALR